MTYPNSAGFKGAIETGRLAADAFTPKLGRRQAEALEALAHGPASAEEISERTGRHWYVVRPRLSELKALGLVVDTGERVGSAFGGKTHRVRTTTAQERADFATARTAEKGVAS